MFEKIKDILAVSREGILIILFIMLLAFPSCFNSILTNAGFTQGSVMGFTWKQQADESQQLADSSQKVAALVADQLEKTKAQLEIATKKLEATPSAASAPEVKQMRSTLDSATQVLTPKNAPPLKAVFTTQRIHLEQLKANLRTK